MRNAANHCGLFSACAAALLLSAVGGGSAKAQLGNLSYDDDELFKSIAIFGPDNDETRGKGVSVATWSGGPLGSNTVVMHKDTLIVMGSLDSGKPPGVLNFFDVSDPRNPELKRSITGDSVSQLRELHAMPIAVIDGQDYLALPTTYGVQLWNITDPMTAAAVGDLDLDGVNGGDYDNAVWQLSWSWPYLFASGTGNGVYVIDAADPSAPRLVTRIETGEMGGFRIGPLHAAGNFLVVSSMDNGIKASVLDVSDPANPFLIATGSGDGEAYSALVVGDRIYMPGAEGELVLLSWNEDEVKQLASFKFGNDKGGYCTYQDEFLLCGQSGAGVAKLDIHDEMNVREVGRLSLGLSGADVDFATVLGNLVFAGNDHGSGSGLAPHSAEPDRTGPSVVAIYPNDQKLTQALSSRITVFFSDTVDLNSVTAENFIVRPGTPGAAPIEGVFSLSSFNAISFGPRAPLLPDETYEVIITANGLKDISGNAVPEQVVTRFSTGGTIKPPRGDVPGTMPEPPMVDAGNEPPGTVDPMPPVVNPTPDAGTTPVPPTGSTMDGGVAQPMTPVITPGPTSSSDGGGCAVSASARDESSTSALAWLFALGFLVRRRHRAIGAAKLSKIIAS